MAPDNGHLLEELGWIMRVAWKKKRREEIKKTKAQCTDAQSTHMSADMTHMSADLAGLYQLARSFKESGQSKDFEEGK